MPQFTRTYRTIMKKEMDSHIWPLLHPDFHCPVDINLIKKWSRVPKFKRKEQTVYLKKLLIYYPKKPQALRPLNRIFTDKEMMEEIDSSFNAKLKKLVLSILSKYNKAYIRRLCIGLINKNVFIEKLAGAVERLLVFQGGPLFERPLVALKKFFVNNKRLKSVSVYEEKLIPLSIAGWLQYLTNIELIKIQDPDYVSSQQNKRILYASNKCLKRVEIVGSLYHAYTTTPSTLTELLNTIVNLKVLEKFKLDVDASGRFNLDKIPFDKLEQKNVAYDIALQKCNPKIKFSKANFASLAKVEVLGINLRESFLAAKDELFVHYHERVHAKARHRLHLNLYDRFNVNLVFLLKACKNVSTLDIFMPKESGIEVDFEVLREYSNIKNLYIHLSDFGANSVNLFTNLALCPKLAIETFYLKIEGDIIEEYLKMMPVFEACAKTLTKLVIYFCGYRPKKEYNIVGLRYIYQSLHKMKTVKSLNLIFDKAGLFMEGLSESVVKLDSLEEFYISTPFNKDKTPLYLQFKNPTRLQRLELEIGDLESMLSFQKELSQLENLRYLRLMMTTLNKETWQKLRQTVKGLPVLETFIVQASPDFDQSVIEMDLKILRDTQLSLKNAWFDRLYHFEDDEEGLITFIL